jgi:hypothetical protein
MARKFLTSIDLNSNELIKAVVQNSTSDPGTGKAGQLYYNTVDDVLKVYSGTASAWVAVGSTEYIGDTVANLLQAGDGIYLDYNDISDSLTIENVGVLSLTGTANEVEVSASAGNVTLSLPSSITVDVTGDLTGNADTATSLETPRAISLGGTLSGSASFDGSSDITITTGDLSGNADTATALETARTISLGGSLSGSASFDGSTDITITADIVADSIALGTDTTGDYVAGATAGDGISVTGSGGEGSTLTIENTGVLSLVGTANEVEVSASAGNITIGLPEDVTVSGDLTVDGDLTVSGSVTYINTETLTIQDNIVLFNSDQTGTPLVDAGIEIERGDEPNSSLYWDESEQEWAVNNGSAAYAISLEGHTHVASDITDFSEAVEDAVDSLVIDTDTVGFTYTDNGSSAGTLAANVLLSGPASASYLTTTGGLSVDKGALETALVADSFTKKYSLTIGDNSATAFTITHNLGSRDVVVNVYDISTYETVEVDIVRTNTNVVTVTFAEAPTLNSYRVVVVG